MKVRIKKIKKIAVKARRTRRRVVQFRIALPSMIASRPLWRKVMATGTQLTALLLVTALLTLSLFSAFEAHVINVVAEPAQIDPPILTPPGDIGWDNPIGGTDLSGTVDVFFSDPDPDATHIYFTFGPGTDPNLVPDPVCGESADADGGGGLKAAVELVPLSLTSDTVIKAIACDGATGSAHQSVTNTKIYTFINTCPLVEVNFPVPYAVLAAGSATSTFDDFLAAAGIEVNGDVRSNHDIRASGGGPNRDINGDAIAGNDVMNANFTISGQTFELATTTSLPDIQIPVWKDRAALGGTVNGSLFFPSGTTDIELGPSEITGNVTFQGNHASVTIKGPLYIHGNLIINQNTTVNQDVSFGDQFATIIVDGTIDIDNNVNFVGSGSIGAFLLVSTSGPKPLDDAAIEVSNDSDPLGDVVLYASEGDVHINSNRVLLAVFATHGTSAANPAIDFDSNVTVDYRALPTVIGCGQEFDTMEQVLINEFMPDPVGFDNAAEPDGEWVELWNGMNVPVDVDGWVLYDSDDTHELFITSINVNASTTIIYPDDRVVVYRDGDADFELDNSGSDEVRLYNGEIGDVGVSLVDNHVYTYPSGAGEGKAFARIPDGTANWIDPDPTPGEPNEGFLDPDITPTEPIVYESEPYIDPATIVEEEPVAESQEAVAGEQTATETQPEEQPPEEPEELVLDETTEQILDETTEENLDETKTSTVPFILPSGSSYGEAPAEEPAPEEEEPPATSSPPEAETPPLTEGEDSGEPGEEENVEDPVEEPLPSQGEGGETEEPATLPEETEAPVIEEQTPETEPEPEPELEPAQESVPAPAEEAPSAPEEPV